MPTIFGSLKQLDTISNNLNRAQSLPKLSGGDGGFNILRQRNGSPSGHEGRGQNSPKAGGKRRRYDMPLRSSGYQLLEKLGEGVTAVVYLAKCHTTQSKVAVKLVDLQAMEAVGGLDVIIKETAIMAAMSHPNILQLLAAFVERNALWMVLPFYSAGSLLSIVQYRYPDGLTDWSAVASIMREVAQGLAYMHAAGRIHRDVKAANILVAPHGRVALADFGVSAALEAQSHERPNSRSGAEASQSQLQPYDGAAMLRRASIQQQAASSSSAATQKASSAAAPSGQSSEDSTRDGGSTGSSSPATKGKNTDLRKMSAAEYRAALRAGTHTNKTAPSLLTASLGGPSQQSASEAPGPTGGRIVFNNVSHAQRYLSRSTFVGTPCWMAPEVMAPQAGLGYGQAADIWSFGITLLEVTTGRAPTARSSIDEILISVVSSPDDDPTSIAGELSHTPKDFQEVVYSCLAKNPSERPTAAQLLGMRFFENSGAIDGVVQSLLVAVPSVCERDARPSPYHSSNSGAATSASVSFLPASRRLRRIRTTVDLSPSAPRINLSTEDMLQTAVSIIRQLARSQLPPHSMHFAFPRSKLQNARGFGFCVMRRGRWLNQGKGVGFVVAKLSDSLKSKSTLWSAPSWFTCMGAISGFPPGVDDVACIFVVRQQSDLDKFTSDRLATVRADEGHKKRHLPHCRCISTGQLTCIAIGKGGSVSSDKILNEQMYGAGTSAEAVVQGEVRPPDNFGELYDELNSVLGSEPLNRSHSSFDTKFGAMGVSEVPADRISAAPLVDDSSDDSSRSGRPNYPGQNVPTLEKRIQRRHTFQLPRSPSHWPDAEMAPSPDQATLDAKPHGAVAVPTTGVRSPPHQRSIVTRDDTAGFTREGLLQSSPSIRNRLSNSLKTVLEDRLMVANLPPSDDNKSTYSSIPSILDASVLDHMDPQSTGVDHHEQPTASLASSIELDSPHDSFAMADAFGAPSDSEDMHPSQQGGKPLMYVRPNPTSASANPMPHGTSRRRSLHRAPSLRASSAGDNVVTWDFEEVDSSQHRTFSQRFQQAANHRRTTAVLSPALEQELTMGRPSGSEIADQPGSGSSHVPLTIPRQVSSAAETPATLADFGQFLYRGRQAGNSLRNS